MTVTDIPVTPLQGTVPSKSFLKLIFRKKKEAYLVNHCEIMNVNMSFICLL